MIFEDAFAQANASFLFVLSGFARTIIVLRVARKRQGLAVQFRQCIGRCPLFSIFFIAPPRGSEFAFCYNR